MAKRKARAARSSTIQTKLLALLLLSVGLPMLLFVGQFYQYSRQAVSRQALEAEETNFHTGLRSLQEQFQLVTYAARSFYFNLHVLELLEDRNGYETITDRQAAEDYIFYMMQSIYSVVPDAALIHMKAYRLGQHFYLSQEYTRLVEPLAEEEAAQEPPVRAYASYLSLSDASAARMLPKQRAAFAVCLPLYAPPSVTDPLGEIRIVIPQERVQQLCSTLFDEAGGELLYVLTDAGEPLYACGGEAPDWVRALFEAEPALNQSHVQTRADGSTVLYEHVRQKAVDLKVVRVLPSTLLRAQADAFVQMLLVLFFCALVMTALFMIVSVLYVTHPLKKLAAYTRAVNRGQLDARMEDYIDYHAADEIGTLVTSVDDMMHTINHYIIRQYQLDAANKEIQLQMLQAQINPHFLYNTLQCLAGQALDASAPELYAAIAALGQMMQYAMDTAHMTVPLAQEQAYAEHYLRLQQLRFPAALREEWSVTPEAGACTVPKMILQPLIENSIRHGGILRRSGCTLCVRAALADGVLTLCVQDDGAGMEPDALALLREKLEMARRGQEPPETRDGPPVPDTGLPVSEEKLKDLCRNVQTMRAHIGLANVYRRLLLYFGPECRMEARPAQPRGLCVCISIPAAQKEEGGTG